MYLLFLNKLIKAAANAKKKSEPDEKCVSTVAGK